MQRNEMKVYSEYETKSLVPVLQYDEIYLIYLIISEGALLDTI